MFDTIESKRTVNIYSFFEYSRKCRKFLSKSPEIIILFSKKLNGSCFRMFKTFPEKRYRSFWNFADRPFSKMKKKLGVIIERSQMRSLTRNFALFAFKTTVWLEVGSQCLENIDLSFWIITPFQEMVVFIQTLFVGEWIEAGSHTGKK